MSRDSLAGVAIFSAAACSTLLAFTNTTLTSSMKATSQLVSVLPGDKPVGLRVCFSLERSLTVVAVRLASQPRGALFALYVRP